MGSEFLTGSKFHSLPWLDHGFGTRLGAVAPECLATARQIHSNVVLIAEKEGLCGEGDALLTSRPGLAVGIKTADCYPILLVDTARHAVGAVHAGWRGTGSLIAMEAIKRMKNEFGTTPADVVAAIGPGIGPCCFEVGEEVACQFEHVVSHGTRAYIDLVQENRKQLEAAGVPPQNIEALGVCTFCDAERFFSYRREKEKAGRMISWIRIKPR